MRDQPMGNALTIISHRSNRSRCDVKIDNNIDIALQLNFETYYDQT